MWVRTLLLALWARNVAGGVLTFTPATHDTSKRVRDQSYGGQDNNWLHVDNNTSDLKFVLPVNDEYMILGTSGNNRRGSPIYLIRLREGNVLEEVAEVRMVQATQFSGIMIDDTTLMVCFEDRDNHRGPLPLGCGVIDIDLTANPPTMTRRIYEAKFIRQGDAFGDRTYNVISDAYQSGNNKLALMAPNKVLFCYMTTDNWGPGPDAWTRCTILSVVGNRIVPSTPYQFGGPSSPGDYEASTYMEIVKMSATEALMCRTPGVKGWIAGGKQGPRWDYFKTECGIVTLNADSSAVTGYGSTAAYQGGRLNDIMDLGNGNVIQCGARTIGNRNFGAYVCRMLKTGAGVCGGRSISNAAEVQVFGSESGQSGEASLRAAITLFQKMDGGKPGVIIACAYNYSPGGYCRSVSWDGAGFSLGPIYYLGDGNYYQALLQRLGDKVVAMANWRNWGVYGRVLTVTTPPAPSAESVPEPTGPISAITLTMTSASDGKWLNRVLGNSFDASWAMALDDNHLLVASDDNLRATSKAPIALVRVNGGNLEKLAEVGLGKGSTATGLRLDDTTVMTCFEGPNGFAGDLPISCYILDVDIAGAKLSLRISQERLISRASEGLDNSGIHAGWWAQTRKLVQIAPNKILLCYLTTNVWGPGPPGWTRCRILSVTGDQITMSDYYQYGGRNSPGDQEASGYQELIQLSATEILACRQRGRPGWVADRQGPNWDWQHTSCGIITVNADASMVTSFEEKVIFDEYELANTGVRDGAARNLRLVSLGRMNFLVCRIRTVDRQSQGAYVCRLITVSCGAERTITAPIGTVRVFGDRVNDPTQVPYGGSWAKSVAIEVMQEMTEDSPALLVLCTSDANAGAYCRSLSTNGAVYTLGPYWQASGNDTPRTAWRTNNCDIASQCNQEGKMTKVGDKLVWFGNRPNHGVYGRVVNYSKTVTRGPPPTPNPTESPTEAPTQSPTKAPTDTPTESPTEPPTKSPTMAPTDPCACTGDNSAIPMGQRKYAGTTYGLDCSSAWDMNYRYCDAKNWQKGRNKDDNRACWCPKPFCWVKKECPHARKSQLFPEAELYYSYQSCGNDGNTCFTEGKQKKSDVNTEEEMYLLSIIPQHNFFFNVNVRQSMDIEVVNVHTQLGKGYPYCTVSSCTAVYQTTSHRNSHYAADDQAGESCFTYRKGGKWRLYLEGISIHGSECGRNAVVSCYRYVENRTGDQLDDYANRMDGMKRRLMADTDGTSMLAPKESLRTTVERLKNENMMMKSELEEIKALLAKQEI